MTSPDLDQWLPDPALRVAHRRQSAASAQELWQAAREVHIGETALLGRLVRWRIPGTRPDQRFDELFRGSPFIVLQDGDHQLVSGMVGRIWTLRRDYPILDDPEAFRSWSKRGTVRVLFANWVQDGPDGEATLHSEARVQPFGAQGRFGLRVVRPLVNRFHNLIGSDGIATAVRRAEQS